MPTHKRLVFSTSSRVLLSCAVFQIPPRADELRGLCHSHAAMLSLKYARSFGGPQGLSELASCPREPLARSGQQSVAIVTRSGNPLGPLERRRKLLTR